MLSRRPTPLDRDAARRVRPGLLAELLDSSRTRVVVTAGDQILVSLTTREPVLRLLAPAEARALIGSALPVASVFLGRSESDVVLLAMPADVPTAGTATAGAATAGPHGPADPQGPGGPPLEEASWAGAREVLPASGPTDAAVVTTAVGLAQWHLSHGFCPACGAATEVQDAGWVRRCPSCAAHQFPRTDPAVIMAVTDDADRLLLGRHGRWPPNRLSVLAGFVEPGETLEDAVRREVGEEAGILVGEVAYAGSEPWPMPRSLMLGFRAAALTTDVTVDGDELVEAGWWSREDLAQAFTEGRVTLPGRLSIARRLIEQWYGGELPEPDELSPEAGP